MGQNMPKQRKMSREQLQGLQRLTSFDETEIQYWYQEFLDCVKSSSSSSSSSSHSSSSSSSSSPRQRRSRFMTSDAFVRTYGKIFPGRCDEFASHVFRTFDQNGDRRLDFSEFLTGMSFSGSDDLSKQLAWAFRLYDVDDSGYITRDNMTDIVQAVFQMLGPRVLRYNNVTVTPETLALHLFTQMDGDGDGRVTWEEFEDGVTRDPTAMQLLQLAPLNDDGLEWDFGNASRVGSGGGGGGSGGRGSGGGSQGSTSWGGSSSYSGFSDDLDG